MWPANYQELIKFPSYCEERQAIIISSENKSKHIAVNKDRDIVRQIKIDGDILPKNYIKERRADYLVLNENKKTAFIIELKGSHVMSAISQIKNTDRKLRTSLKDYTIFWRIVCSSRTTNLNNNEIKKLKKKFPLEVGHHVYEEKI